MSSPIELKESPIRDVTSAGVITYSLDTTDYGGTPTNVTVTAKNLTTGQTVTAQVLSGSASVSTDTITWPAIQNLTPNNTYAVDCQFDCSGNTYLRRIRVIVGDA